jgi:hypothetical protein
MAARSPISSARIELLEATVWAELHGRFGLEAGGNVATVKRWAALWSSL